LFGPQNVRSSHNNGKTEANYGLEKEIDYNQIQEERERERERLCNKRKKRIFPLLMSYDTFRWYNFSKRGARREI
jgi:hypothetical protein